MTAPDFKRLGLHIQGSAGYYSNFILMQESGYFDVASASKPLLHLWSLAIEEQFYIIWPLLLWCFTKLPFSRLWPTTVLLTLLVLFTLHASHDSSGLARLYYSPPTRFWELIAGGIMAAPRFLVACGWTNGNSPPTVVLQTMRTRLPDIFAFAGAGMIAAGLALTDQHDPYPDIHSFLPVVGTMLVICGGPHSGINRKLFSNRGLVWLGLISYPLYLWHWPILSFAHVLGMPVENHVLPIGLLVLAAVLAWLTKRFVETPFRQPSRRHAKAAVLMSTLFMIGFLGHFVYQHNGLAARYGVRDLKIVPGRYECADEAKNSGCQFGNPLADKLIVIAGDSHAEQYTNALRIKLGDKYRFISVTNGSCSMSDRKFPVEPGDPQDCQRAMLKVHSLKGTKIFALIRVQRWHGYGISSAQDISVAATDAMRGYDLHAQKVIVMGATPDVDFDCDMSNYFMRAGGQARQCHSTERFKDYVRQFEKTTRALAKSSNVSFIYPYNIVCPSGECHTIEGDIAIFEDFHHLTTDGAMKVMPDIERALEKVE